MSQFVIDLSGRAINLNFVQHFYLDPSYDDGVYIVARLMHHLNEPNQAQGPRSTAIKKVGEKDAWNQLWSDRKEVLTDFLKEIS